MAPSSKPAAAPVAQKQANGPAPQATSVPGSNEPTVNRKKQKRRQKQAAKLAAEQALGDEDVHQTLASSKHNGYPPSPHAGYDAPEYDDRYDSKEEFYSDAEARSQGASKSKKKKKKKSRSQQQHDYEDPYDHPSMPGSFHQGDPHPPPLQNPAVARSSRGVSKDRIWNTSTAEERERIKEFWLSLEETERRSLVKVEKEAVLKKMKEQQRNSCSCTICGRKRTAIEEELEVLYDAYYEELEQYANHQQIDGSMMPPPGAYPPIPRSRPQHLPGPPKGRIMEQFEDDEELDEDDYSDEEYSEGDYDDEPRGPATEFFNFGNSLTVQGGILTVADDLLKNDGKKFIEMMEQLAERRMAREKMHIGRYEQAPARHPSLPGHDHGPPLDDEDDYDDEDDVEYDDSGDEYDDEEEMEAMSEEQRMEEGRRMFQIFAARMFEQRVLTAYREKVAKERQERLIEELNDEDALKAQREAKKAKEAQKKKDKKKQQKAAKEEERLKREAEKAAEIAAAKAIEEKKAEEQRLKKEQQRKKKEAEKKAQEEERLKKEAEKQQRLREQQAEAERRQREAKEKEKKRKDEAKKKEREEKEREAKSKKDKEREEREKEAKAKAEREASQHRKDEASKQTAPPVPVVPSIARKPSAIVPSIPPGLQPTTTSNHASPHLQVATPAIPKAPSPVKPRQTSASQQDSHHSSPKSAQMPSDSSTTSASSSHQQAPPGLPPVPKSHMTQHSQVPASIAPPPGIHAHHYPPMSSPSLPGSGFAPVGYNPAPSMPPRMPGPDMYPHQPVHAPFRPYPGPGNFGFPPGINMPRQLPQGRGSPVDGPSPPAPIGSSAPQYVTSHSRQPSGSYERNSVDQSATQPISRPAPIERPSSLPHQDEQDVEDMSKRLGSSALGDSMEDGPDLKQQEPRGVAPGGPRPGRLGFGPFPDLGHSRMNNFGPPHVNTWGGPPMHMGPMPSQPPWPATSGPGWSNSNFGAIGGGAIGGGGGGRINPAHLRTLACRACRQLSAANPNKAQNDFHSVTAIMREMDHLKAPSEGPIIETELLKVLEAEGSSQNGGGSFDIDFSSRGAFARYEANSMPFGGHMAGAPGEIGSPVVGGASPFVNRGFPLGGTPGL